MSRLLSDLHPKAQPLFFELLARAAEAQILLMLICTGRTVAEQAAIYAIGRTDGQPASAQVTWTMDSKHVMSPKQEMKSLAIDVCPYAVYQIHGERKLDWDSKDPVWAQIGAIGQSVGLKWGGRWSPPDVGHFEFSGPIT